MSQVQKGTLPIDAVEVGIDVETMKGAFDPCIVSMEHGNSVVITTGEKRKHSVESDDNENSIDNAVSSSYEVHHNHTYCVSSPRRLKKKYDNLLDIKENLQEMENISQESP